MNNKELEETTIIGLDTTKTLSVDNNRVPETELIDNNMLAETELIVENHCLAETELLNNGFNETEFYDDFSENNTNNVLSITKLTLDD